MSLTTIVFDLDGTLVDTAPDLIDTLNVIFRREGIAPVPYDAARSLIGGGAKAMIARGAAAEGLTLPTAELERMFADFLVHYSAHIADRSRPFPGLVETLDRLAADGHRFSVCTNKLEALSRQLLGALGLIDRFDVICGQDTYGVQKPDPLVLRRTIDASGGVLDQAIMVGDSITDIKTARAAGIPVIAVDFGYTETPVSELGPDVIISNFTELPVAIAHLRQK